MREQRKPEYTLVVQKIKDGYIVTACPNIGDVALQQTYKQWDTFTSVFSRLLNNCEAEELRSNVESATYAVSVLPSWHLVTEEFLKGLEFSPLVNDYHEP